MTSHGSTIIEEFFMPYGEVILELTQLKSTEYKKHKRRS
jgi:hypothetical protein